jgi:FMN phosphatase YigB (HAD superfamily)
VGDQIYFDCDGAKQAGMKAVLLDGIVQHVDPSQCIFTPDAIIPDIGQVPYVIAHK